MTRRAEYATARNRIKELTRELNLLQHTHSLAKAGLDAYRQATKTETIRNLILEYNALINAADPIPTPTEGPKSAETGSPGQATQWARAKLEQTNRRLQQTTREIQAALKTPPEERTPIDNSGRCVGCGRKGKQR